MGKHYLNNRDLEATYRKAMNGDKAAQEELGNMIRLLAVNVFNKWRFSLVDREDMLSDVVCEAWSKLDRFQSGKGKLFNYLTTVILNRSKQVWRQANNYNNLKDRYGEHLLVKQPWNRRRNRRDNRKPDSSPDE